MNTSDPDFAFKAALIRLNVSGLNIDKILQKFRDDQMNDEKLLTDKKCLINYIPKAGPRVHFWPFFEEQMKLKKLLQSASNTTQIPSGPKLHFLNSKKMCINENECQTKESTSSTTEGAGYQSNKENDDDEFFDCPENDDEEKIEMGIDLGLIENMCTIYKKELKSQIEKFKKSTNSNYLIKQHMEESHVFAIKALKLEQNCSNSLIELKAKTLSRINEILFKEEAENTTNEVLAVSEAQKLLETHIAQFQEMEIIQEKFSNILELKKFLDVEATGNVLSFEINVKLCEIHKNEMILSLKNALDEEIKQKFNNWIEIAEFNSLLKNVLIRAKSLYKDKMNNNFENNQSYDQTKLDEIHQNACKITYVLLKEDFQKFINEEQLNDAKGKIDILLNDDFNYYIDQNLANRPNPKAWIGADLGTTFSSVSVYVNGKFVNIPIDQVPSIPSIVAYNNQHDKNLAIVGRRAAQNAFKHPKTTFLDAKRIMGKFMSDKNVQIDRKFWPFSIDTESGDQDEPVRFVAEYEEERILISPEEISAQILLKLFIPAIKYLKKERRTLAGAVIGIPAKCTGQFKEATLAAVQLAINRLLELKLIDEFDMKNVKFISEPVAVAHAYRPHIEKGKNIFILDIGGGTLDITILNVGKDVEVICTSGNAHLGGQDIDNYIYTFIRNKYKEIHGIDIEEIKPGENRLIGSQRRSRLKTAIETKKKDLSGAESPPSVKFEILNFFPNYSKPDFEFLLKKEDFEMAITKFYEDMRKAILEAIGSSKIEFDKIDDVVLVGGTTNFSKIRSVVEEIFGEKKLHDKVDKELAVSFGAAFEAARKNGEIEQLQSELFEVLPMSVGVESQTGLFAQKKIFDIIIPKNTKLPHDGLGKYSTIYPNQESVKWVVREGENRDEPEENNKIGEFMLEGIPPNGDDLQDLTCKMSMDDKLRLVVTATCVCNGKQETIEINDERGKISEQDFNYASTRIALGTIDDF